MKIGNTVEFPRGTLQARYSLEEPRRPVYADKKEHDLVANNPLRTAVRFPMKLSLRVTTPAGTLEAITDNISANGILFTGPDLPEVDSRIEFTISMPAAIMGTPEDVSVHCIGRVVRHQQHGQEAQAAAIIDEYFMRV